MSGPLTYTAVTDRVVRTRPTLPTLGAANTTITDPTYGTRILRVTDVLSAGGASLRSLGGAGNTQAWNLDSNRFILTQTFGGCAAYAFNAATMQATSLGNLNFLASYGCTFSLLDPNVMYGLWSASEEATVASYNFVTGTYTPIIGVRTLVPTVDNAGRTYLRGISTGVKNGIEYLSFIFGGTGQEYDHYIYLAPLNNITAGKLIDTITSTLNGAPLNGGYTMGWYLHAGYVDMSSDFQITGPSTGVFGPYGSTNIPKVILWNTTTDTFTTLGGGAPGEAGGHGAAGYGDWVNFPNNAGDGMDTRYRTFAAPTTLTSLVSPFETPHDISIANHASWSNAAPGQRLPICAAWYRYGSTLTTPPIWDPDIGPWRAYDDELVMVDTSGGATLIYRICHHRSECNIRSTVADTDWFWYTPRPNVSVDGKWAVFTSNWDKTLGLDSFEIPTNSNFRQDAFVVELPTTGVVSVPSLHRRHGSFHR
jgi:hypothetical protein